jgi:cytochrome oxidase Cu insertion factor (SCO1/SenC/PrrC family)
MMKSMFSRVTAGLALLIYVILAISVTASAQGATSAPADQATMAFQFTATDMAGTEHSLNSYLEDGKFVILEWFNPDCPYVKKYHSPDSANESQANALAFAREHDVVWLMVNSNAPGKQGSGSERNERAKKEYGIDVPLILDASGEIGQAYGATSTPQIFLINPEGEILYNGGIDDTKLASDVPQHNYVINAISQAQAGEPVDPASTPHPGCSVKYPD